MKSIGQKIQQIAGLAGTKDVSLWEEGFITTMVKTTVNGADTTKLTDKQVAMVERIWSKAFA